ncbi:methyl-accepting chemotaxis protein [uncultured Propionivibrio sp.]|uniref:methyl-accepting chemotaxis protein n=1 Tax=uncultured Propionivibrio sp. TaxID=426737 RepID=UPI0029BFD3C0|nr:methyl-accepting chemotaxis protein [uncultured Propionivibrio sp.]
MGNLSIGRRLQIMAGVAMASLLILAASGVNVAYNLRSSVSYVYRDTLPSVELIDAINEDFLRLRLTVLYHFLTKETEKKDALEGQMKGLKEKLRSKLAEYEQKFVTGSKGREIFEKEKKLFETYFIEIQPAIDSSRAKNEDALWASVKQATGSMQLLSETLAEHKKYREDLASERIAEAKAVDDRSMIVSLILVVASLASVGLISYFVTREIRTRMGRLSDLMNQVNETLDFTARVKVTRMDELGTSGDAFNKLLDKLQASLKAISTNTESVANAATDMATTSKQVATSSHLQAEAASNMAATIEEMTVSINHVADRALETSRLANESGKLASEGEHVIEDTTQEIQNIAATVNQAATLIHGLENHSQQISNVVQVIKDVAEQTNLLALNAAIEAARAGEQGRGFAVVADEVRKLAERTSASTQEIAETIQAMRDGASNAVVSMESVVSQVKIGVEKSKSANASMRQIGEGARGSFGMVEEITEAIREQGAATNNIAAQVERIAQMSEESSAAAGNSANSASNLDTLAKEMHQIVSQYKLA